MCSVVGGGAVCVRWGGGGVQAWCGVGGGWCGVGCVRVTLLPTLAGASLLVSYHYQFSTAWRSRHWVTLPRCRFACWLHHYHCPGYAVGIKS